MTNQDLRAMVRDVLKEALPQKGGALGAVESVRIVNDAELAAFVRRVLEKQDAVRAGQLRFTLGAATAAPSSSAGGAIITGVVTEHVVNRHASAGVLVVGPDAVVTPLARDRARKLNLKIERRR
jgi:hypothetical protein